MRNRRKNRNTKTPRVRRRTRHFSVWMSVSVLSFAVIIFAGGYLAQISATSSKGFAIRTLQNEIDDLKSEMEVLEFEVAKEMSMVAVEEKVLSMGMIPVSEIDYMASSDAEPFVARR